MRDMLARIAALEAMVYGDALGNPLIRLCTIYAVDSAAWTATVSFGERTYTGIKIGHHIRPEQLAINTKVLVMFDSFDSPYNSVLFCTFEGKPAGNLDMDNVMGHSHRKGVPGDGAPVAKQDLVDKEVEE